MYNSSKIKMTINYYATIAHLLSLRTSTIIPIVYDFLIFIFLVTIQFHLENNKSIKYTYHFTYTQLDVLNNILNL